MLESGAFPTLRYPVPPVSPMSAPVVTVPTAMPSARACAGAVVALVALFVAAQVTANPWLNATAVFALVSVLLQSGLRHRKPLAWIAWLSCAVALVALGNRGNGRLALDILPAILNAAFCGVFASTLTCGSTPLIARIIEAIEGSARLALPRVSAYARALTWAWALLLGVQALLLGWLALRDVGAIEHGSLSTSSWRWYLHFGGVALVPSFLVLEYAFRRWWLRHIPHASLTQFLVQLARNWPALIRGVVLDAARPQR